MVVMYWNNGVCSLRLFFVPRFRLRCHVICLPLFCWIFYVCYLYFVLLHLQMHCDEDNEIAGVYADLDFQEGGLVLKDQMLFGVQHSSNKVSYIHIIVVCYYACRTLSCVFIASL